MSDQKRLCTFCGIQGTLKCGRCYECYCSFKCQREDWAEHKIICNRIRMPTLIQPVRSEKFSVNARLERTFFQNNPMKSLMTSTPHIPLRKPHRYDQSDDHSESGCATSSNLGTIDKSDIPRLVALDNNNKERKSIDFPLKLLNKNGEDDSISLNVQKVIDKVEDISFSNASEKTNRPNKAWKNHFPIPENECFEVVVQYVSETDPTLAWVMDARWEAACTSLILEINKNITNVTNPYSEEIIYVGNVVAAPFRGLYYRAVVLEEKNPLNEVRVRRLDYGNDFYINVNQLKSLIPAMKDLNSYAFCIKCNGKAFDTGHVVRIKIIGNIYNEKEELPINMKIKIVNVFKEMYAIAIVKPNEIADQLSKMRQVLAGDTENKFKLLHPVEGSFIAGKTSTQWERGFLLSYYESHYVIYCVDIGQIELLSEVKSIPNDFKNIPRQALLISAEKEAHLEDYWGDGSTLELKTITNNGTTNYELYSNANKLEGNVKVSKDWNGYFGDISIKYWSAGPKPNDEVQITHIHSHSEISVCKHDKGEIYSKIFDQKGREAAKTDAIKDKIVLAFNQSRFVRCKVLDKLPNEVLLLDLDSGESFKAKEGDIKEADNFVRYAPVFVIKGTLLHLSKIKASKLNKAVDSLKSCINERKKFTISFLKNEIELYVNSTSYNKQLIPLLFEETTNGEENNNNKVEKVKEIQDVRCQNFFHINDVERIPIPTGQLVKIFVLNDSMIEHGLITAAHINPELLTKLQTDTENIMKYCLDPSIPQGYSPRENELCFSINEVDNQWYRAGCLRKLSDDKFLMIFVDYGNTTIKGKKDLRKITKDFLYQSPANTCEIDGLPHVMSTELLKRIKSIVQPDVVLRADNVKKSQTGYIITMGKIKKLLP